MRLRSVRSELATFQLPLKLSIAVDPGPHECELNSSGFSSFDEPRAALTELMLEDAIADVVGVSEIVTGMSEARREVQEVNSSHSRSPRKYFASCVRCHNTALRSLPGTRRGLNSFAQIARNDRFAMRFRLGDFFWKRAFSTFLSPSPVQLLKLPTWIGSGDAIRFDEW